MKKTMGVMLLVVLAGALAVAVAKDSKNASKNEAVEQQIKQAEQQLRSDVIKGDSTSLERFEADDYVSVGGSGRILNKSESIKEIKEGRVKFNAINVKEETVRVYGDTAIYGGLANVKMTVNGDDRSGDYRVTIVWARLDGQWKRVSFQSTPVIPEAAK